MKIYIAGQGCPRCKETENIVRKACEEMKINAEVEQLYDVKKMAEFGVTITPAVIIENKIVLSGRVPDIEEMKKILKEMK